MFWGKTVHSLGLSLMSSSLGLKLKKGNNYSQKVEDSFHVTQATLVPSGDKDDAQNFTEDIVAVHAVVNEEDYTLCYLGKIDCETLVVQRALNLKFVEGEAVTLYIDVLGDLSTKKKDHGAVHLTGFFDHLLPEDSDIEWPLMFGRDEDCGNLYGDYNTSEEDDCECDDCTVRMILHYMVMIQWQRSKDVHPLLKSSVKTIKMSLEMSLLQNKS